MSGIATRKYIHVHGIVQGVGFRPFVYTLARTLHLTGYVLNSSDGVVIEIEGNPTALDHFLHQLTSAPPPLAHIDDIQIHELQLQGDGDFVIRNSVEEPGKFALVSPDVATCEVCWQECSDPHTRRYGYPFTNCTHCGPRYTIITDIPYDRPFTTMAPFRMCAACHAEYIDPTDRRFHAQPNACPDCGPTLALVPHATHQTDSPSALSFNQPSLPILRAVRRLLCEGQIVAIKSLGGFQLACNAANEQVVSRLRQRKRRSDKPFALMAPDLPAVERLCVVSATDRHLLLQASCPIVILPRCPGAEIAAAVAPGNTTTVGVMLPYTPLHHLLFRDTPHAPPAFPALVMTSGNSSEEPIVTSNQEAWERLSPLADWFLFHNRDIGTRVDDSVVRTFGEKERVVRRARGYAPYPITLGMPVAEILACGPELKNTFCLTKDRYAFLSQHLGDLANYETLGFFQETLARMKKLFRIAPTVVAHDLHPRYLSTRIAWELENLERVGVQHHHAHIASCMAENHVQGKVIGVAFDGTGYGTDGQIWGGEFLVADFASFERRAQLRYVALPGGDMAIREPWRVALSYVVDTFGAQGLTSDWPLWQQLAPQRLALVHSMITRGVQTVQTSSCGRLFDAVASLIGLRHEITFEGQAAIELEHSVVGGNDEIYPFTIIASGDPWQIDLRPMIERIVHEVRHKQSPGVIAAKFHNTLAAVIVAVCQRLRKREGLSRVCLSGGTFQNMLLLERTVAGLQNCGFTVFLHSQVPPNDGGISLGQAVVANAVLTQGG